MALHITTDVKGIILFKIEHESKYGKFFTYNTPIAKKSKDSDKYITTYVPVILGDNAELNNKAVILVSNGFLTFDKARGRDYVKIFAQEYELLDAGENELPQQINEEYKEIVKSKKVDLDFV